MEDPVHDHIHAAPSGQGGIWTGYADEDRPLAAYSVLASVFLGAASAAAIAARRSRRPLPARLGAADIVLIGAATQKLSRLVSKDSVTSFARAPFTRYEEPGGPGEVNESPRGTGFQLAIGELLACPFCLAQWISAGFVGGLVFAPRATRLVASTFAAKTIADFLQLAYSAAEQRTE